MKNLIAAIFLFGGVFFSSAQNIDDYKYILIPESYEFLGEVNQYQLNALTKFLFEREGFNTLMSTGEKPQDLSRNGCLGLSANVLNNSGIFVTKLQIELKDCNGKVIFKSEEGRSREKEFKVAYNEALRDAFKSVEKLNYKYDPTSEKSSEESVETVAVKFAVDTTSSSEITNESSSQPEIIEKEAKSEPSEDKPKYVHKNKSYLLNKNSQGLALFQEGSTEPIAMLIETDGGKSYIYNSLTRQGIAYFDANENLVVEYFDQQQNKKVILKYELSSQ
ncbi:hypothetical protein ML462_12320 [Gramella lutea]|uniref:Uncharacterized protein n=1 Tax=Christiangramia lutea TaxID=1607951 RepID=A0A9X1V4Z3_9FLAO|nr:hypothetical protein [Christiangramia lutea]MCH4823955.1 hypothetical protein [Christiangramia lutea]